MRWVWLLMVMGVVRGEVLAPERLQALLPKSAQVIEVADVSRLEGKGRELVLWMENPRRVMETLDGGGCPASFYGDYWEGKTRLSLVDTEKVRLLRTLRLTGESYDGKVKDSLAIPFWLRGSYGPWYRTDKGRDGKPVILHLVDLTGDRVASEFALYVYASCGLAETSAYGYRVRDDNVVRYPMMFRVNQRKESGPRLWVLEVFRRPMAAPGKWDFEWQTGYGCNDDLHDRVRFDEKRQVFVDRRTVRKNPDPVPGREWCGLWVF